MKHFETRMEEARKKSRKSILIFSILFCIIWMGLAFLTYKALTRVVDVISEVGVKPYIQQIWEGKKIER